TPWYAGLADYSGPGVRAARARRLCRGHQRESRRRDQSLCEYDRAVVPYRDLPHGLVRRYGGAPDALPRLVQGPTPGAVHAWYDGRSASLHLEADVPAERTGDVAEWSVSGQTDDEPVHAGQRRARASPPGLYHLRGARRRRFQCPALSSQREY